MTVYFIDASYNSLKMRSFAATVFSRLTLTTARFLYLRTVSAVV